MKIAIKDANIIFDLYDMGLLEIFTSLNFRFITSDFVKSEVRSDGVRQLLGKQIALDKIQIVGLDAYELLDLYNFQQKHKGLSISDCSVFYLAEKHNAIILSGDKLLRNTAKAAGIEYHGILWILDKLIESNKLTKSTAKTKLIELMKVNKRLPSDECNKRIEKRGRL